MELRKYFIRVWEGGDDDFFNPCRFGGARGCLCVFVCLWACVRGRGVVNAWMYCVGVSKVNYLGGREEKGAYKDEDDQVG